MRKTKQAVLLPNIPHKQSETNSSMSSSFGPISSLERFQNQLNKYQIKIVKPKLQMRSKTIDHQAIISNSQKKLLQQIRQATQGIHQIKKQINQRKKDKDSNHFRKLSRMITSLQQSNRQNQLLTSVKAPQPIFYPVPMPYPQPNQEPITRMTRKSIYRHSNSYKNSKFQSFYDRPSPRYDKNRLKKNMRIWKKAANCCLFMFYLKRFCQLAQKDRKKRFKQLLSHLKSKLSLIKSDLFGNLKQFYKTLLIKRQVQFQIQQGENKQIIKQKKNSLRKLVQLLIELTQKWVEKATKSAQIIQIFYHLCFHGNFSPHQPLLTLQQLQITSLSHKFNYVSAQKNLTKSAILNLLYFKQIIYSILVSQQMTGPFFKDQNVTNNIILISSIFYQLCIQVQDDIMLQVPKSYTIGNHQELDWVQITSSLVLKRAAKRPGQMISGLKGEWVLKNFKLENWQQQKKKINQCVNLMFKSLSSYHSKIIQKHY